MPSDPRAAVLVAYARMESALAEAGLERRPSEAPREYLGRITGRLGVAHHPPRRSPPSSSAATQTHLVDESMRHDAVAALQQIADDLKDDRS